MAGRFGTQRMDSNSEAAQTADIVTNESLAFTIILYSLVRFPVRIPDARVRWMMMANEWATAMRAGFLPLTQSLRKRSFRWQFFFAAAHAHSTRAVRAQRLPRAM